MATKHEVSGDGTKQDPWKLQTPSLSRKFEMYRDPEADPPTLACQVGKTQMRYHLRSIGDLRAMLTVLGLAEVEHEPRNDRMRAS